MLNLLGSELSRTCDGVNRRNFLKVGSLGLGSLGLSDLLRLRAQAAPNRVASDTSVVWLWLGGGATHVETFDPKMTAPAEYRSAVGEVATRIPGVTIGGLFPKIAELAEHFSFVRSFAHSNSGHGGGTHYVMTGYDYPPADQNMPPIKPSLGSIVARERGASHPQSGIPTYVRMNGIYGDGAAWLGTAYGPFDSGGEAQRNMNMQLTLDRLGDRRAVLTALDRFRKDCDSSGQLAGTDAFTQQAFGVLTSSKLAEALNLDLEDQKLRDRYGRGVNQLRDDGGPRLIDNFLVARRLISAGARCVTLAFSRWDWHGANFQQGREDMPLLDQGLVALVQDLEERGMLDDISVVCWGEFGRTPKVNKDAGRDHWPQVSCALLAGGGIRAGQVIGATNRLGEFATDRPVHFQEVFATLYHNLGINVDHLTLRDLQGRPQFLIDQNKYKALPELL